MIWKILPVSLDSVGANSKIKLHYQNDEFFHTMYHLLPNSYKDRHLSSVVTKIQSLVNKGSNKYLAEVHEPQFLTKDLWNHCYLGPGLSVLLIEILLWTSDLPILDYRYETNKKIQNFSLLKANLNPWANGWRARFNWIAVGICIVPNQSKMKKGWW